MNLVTLILLSFMPYLAIYIGLHLLSNAWAAILGYHLIIIIVLIIKYKDIDRITLAIKNKFLLIAGSTLILTLPLMLLFIWDYIKLANLELDKALYELGLSGTSFVIFIIYFSTIHPFLEELYWRYIISKNKGAKSDYLFDVIFAGYHVLVLVMFIKIPFIILSLLILSLSGMTWRYIKNKYDDNLTVFATHALADFLLILTIFILE